MNSVLPTPTFIRPSWPFVINSASIQARGLAGWWVGFPAGKQMRELIRGRHGVFAGGISWEQDVVIGGHAIKDDGVDGEADAPLVSPFDDITSTTWTLWVYVYPGNHGGAFIKVGRHDDVLNNGWAVGIGDTTFDDNGTKLILLHEGVEWHASTYDFVAGWNHIAVNHNASSQAEIFVNGISRLTDTSAPDAPTAGVVAIGGYTNTIGGGPYNRHVECLVADVRCYRRLLGAAEIRAQWLPETRWELYAKPRRLWFDQAAAAAAQTFNPSWARYPQIAGVGVL